MWEATLVLRLRGPGTAAAGGPTLSLPLPPEAAQANSGFARSALSAGPAAPLPLAAPAVPASEPLSAPAPVAPSRVDSPCGS